MAPYNKRMPLMRGVMRHKRIVAIVAFGFVVVATWLSSRSTFDSPHSVTNTEVQSVPQARKSGTLAPAASGEKMPALIESVNGVGQPEELLVKDLGLALYTRFKKPFVEFLVNRGLSREDSQRVIGEAFHGAASCWFDAVRSQDVAEGNAFNPVHERASGALSDARMLDQLSTSCINSALERVGVNPPLGIRARDA